MYGSRGMDGCSKTQIYVYMEEQMTILTGTQPKVSKVNLSAFTYSNYTTVNVFETTDCFMKISPPN